MWCVFFMMMVSKGLSISQKAPASELRRLCAKFCGFWGVGSSLSPCPCIYHIRKPNKPTTLLWRLIELNVGLMILLI